MEDEAIIALYWAREERAIREAQGKYGPLCRSAARGILPLREDQEECLNDVWQRSWQSIPPERPARLGAWLAKLSRNLALDRWRRSAAAKRGHGQPALALEELGDCVGGGEDPAEAVERRELAAALERFLLGLEPEERRLFLLRYWYLKPVKELAGALGLRPQTASMRLSRLRARLRAFLKEEGFSV